MCQEFKTPDTFEYSKIIDGKEVDKTGHKEKRYQTDKREYWFHDGNWFFRHHISDPDWFDYCTKEAIEFLESMNLDRSVSEVKKDNKTWHVWRVDSYLYVANSLEQAIDAYCQDYGDDPEGVDYDECHYDNADWYDDLEDAENFLEPSGLIGQQAEHMIKNGSVIPFGVGRAID